MISALALMACPNLAIPPRIMYHVAMVESHASPFAIGVVGGRLARQPKDLAEAVATARMLETHGYDFSIGIAQVNRANLARYGLDTYEKAFDVCPNLLAGSRILARCYANARGEWGKAFSCYYSGDHVTGFRDGYVGKIFASLNQGAGAGGDASAAVPLSVLPEAERGPVRPARGASVTPDSAAYRITIRTVGIDAMTNVALAPATATTVSSPAPTGPANPATASTADLATDTPPPATPVVAAMLAGPLPQVPAARDGSIFIPQVTGPGETTTAAPHAAPTAVPSASPTDPGDPRHASRDDAFVF